MAFTAFAAVLCPLKDPDAADADAVVYCTNSRGANILALLHAISTFAVKKKLANKLLFPP